MTTADHGMPPRQPDENDPAGPPTRDILDIIDETAAQITDDDVDERLRDVLSRAGCRSRHAGGASAPPQSGDGPAAAPRRRSFSGFLTALSGADREILDLVPSERGKFARLGSTVLIAGGTAAVSMWSALAAMGINAILAAPVGLLWALAVTGIARWLVRSMPVSSTWRMLAIAAPRLALALLLGALISAPLVFATFQQQINTKIPAIKNQQVTEFFFATPQRMHIALTEANLQLQIRDLKMVIASRGRVKVALFADPRGEALNAQLSSEIALALEYYLQAECAGFGGKGCEKAPSAAGFVIAWDFWGQTSAQVNNLADQVLTRIDQLNAAPAPAAVHQAQDELPAMTSQLNAVNAQMTVLLDSLHAQQDSAYNRVLVRLEALDRLTASDSAISVACLVAFLLFLVIESLPVTVKLLQRPGTYEKILARRIVDEHLKTPAAAQEQVRLQRQAAGQEEHPLAAPKPQDAMPAQASSATEPLTVPEHLRKQIDSIFPFMKDPGETTAPAYREELENCCFAISQAVDELRRKGFDSDQITEALRVVADMATRQLAAAWQAGTHTSASIRR